MILLKYLDFSTLAQDANKIKAVQDISCLMDFPSTNEVGFIVKLLFKLFVVAHQTNSLLYSRFRLFLLEDIGKNENSGTVSRFSGGTQI